MTTSGAYTVSRNRDKIIKTAARKVGAIEAGETPDADTVNDFADALNDWIKHLQGTGVYIWTMAEATLFLQADQTTYTLSSTSTDNATESFVETALSAAAISGATSITVDSITGISASDYIGVQVDDGTIHWTTVNGAPSGSTITLTAGLDDSASDDALVITYTTKIVRPLKIVSARRYNFDSALDTPLMVEDRETYFDLPDKTNSGTPNIIFYDRRGGANAAGRLYVWQPQTSPTEAIKFTWARPIQVFSAAANDADLPDEWVLALTFNLALIMAPEYGVPPQTFQMLGMFASKYLTEVTWNEKELEGISFSPDMRRRA